MVSAERCKPLQPQALLLGSHSCGSPWEVWSTVGGGHKGRGEEESAEEEEGQQLVTHVSHRPELMGCQAGASETGSLHILGNPGSEACNFL